MLTLPQHCNVAQREESKLGRWVDSQRQSKKKNKLSNEREGLLNQLGFVWDCAPDLDAAWLEKYQELKQFREKHGVRLSSINFFLMACC